MSNKRTGFRIVGIGASAGGLEAFAHFLPMLKPDKQSVYIIAQHMGKNDDHIELLYRLLKRHSALPVVLATHNDVLVVDQVFLIPPCVTGIVREGCIQLLPVTADQISSPSVNALLSSIALSAHKQGVGIILSGAGSDGVSGARAIKAQGGKVIVQSPESCQLQGMPGAVIAAKLADEILLPEQIAQSLNNGAPQLLAQPQTPAPSTTTPTTTTIQSNRSLKDDAEIFKQLLQAVVAITGNDFSNYKEETLLRRLHRRMSMLKIASLQDYQTYTQKYPDELCKLQHQFLISLSFFFRDRESFAVLKQRVNELLEHKARGDSIRIWVPGCASGEECYSWAILLAEILGSRFSDYAICILGSDLNGQAIAVAKQGRYLQAAFRDTELDILDRYFDRNGPDFNVKPRIRQVCHFHHEDVLGCRLPEKVDAISCRNLLIYMKSELQDKLIRNFHDFLNPGGLLFLGQAETIGLIGTTLFSPLDHFHRVYRRKLKSK
ncbi:MAG TPA: CheR family methyltransferase [Cellvibrio sp.]|nr:CheR family methyltransferase [Cellvibrio sp.]